MRWSPPLAELPHIVPWGTLRLLTLFNRLLLKWIEGSNHFFFFSFKPQPWLFLVVNTGTPMLCDASRKRQDDKKQNVTSHWVVDPYVPHPSYWWKKWLIKSECKLKILLPKGKTGDLDELHKLFPATEDNIFKQSPGRINTFSGSILLLSKDPNICPDNLLPMIGCNLPLSTIMSQIKCFSFNPSKSTKY